MYPAELGGKGEEGSKLCKYTSILMLPSSILRMRRKPKKEGMQGQKEIVQGVGSQSDGKKLARG